MVAAEAWAGAEAATADRTVEVRVLLLKTRACWWTSAQ